MGTFSVKYLCFVDNIFLTMVAFDTSKEICICLNFDNVFLHFSTNLFNPSFKVKSLLGQLYILPVKEPDWHG